MRSSSWPTCCPCKNRNHNRDQRRSRNSSSCCSSRATTRETKPCIVPVSALPLASIATVALFVIGTFQPPNTPLNVCEAFHFPIAATRSQLRSWASWRKRETLAILPIPAHPSSSSPSVSLLSSAPSTFDIDAPAFNENDDTRSSCISDEASAVHLRGLNPSQIEAVTQPTCAITRVVAGPGAGKTRVLTCRIAHLLRSDSDESSRILAVTFTKKAAGEMKHRLDVLLSEQREVDRLLKKKDDEVGQSGGAVMTAAKMQGNGVNNRGDEIVQEEAREDGSASGSQKRSPSSMDRVTLGTFHSVCAKILRWNGKELSSLPSIALAASDGKASPSTAVLDGSFAIVDQSEQIRIVKEALKECDITLKGSGGGGGKADIRPITILNAVCQLKSEDMIQIVGLKSNLLTDGKANGRSDAGGLKLTKKVREIAEEIYPKYRRALLTSNSLDFDDLILLTRELLLVNAEARNKLHRRWSHILVDEFQDTSKVQLDLVKLLTTRSLLVVGDGDQSIYSWRGAHAESMSDFVQEFHGHGVSSADHYGSDDSEDETNVKTVFLMENYRSTTNIVKAAQKIISDSSSISENERQNMKPMRGKGPTPRVLACADAKAEASFVIRTIHQMVDQGDLSPESTIAIIYRTNAQSRTLEEQCVAQNLKYLVRGSAGTFYSRAEVKDCLCFLRCLYNSRDKSGMIRAFKTPSRGIGDVAMAEFFAYCDEVDAYLESHHPNEPRINPLQVLISLADNSSEHNYPPASDFMSTRALNRFLPFSTQMKKIYQKSSVETVSGLLSSIIDELDLRSHFDTISKTSEEFSDRMSNVFELLNAAERYDNDGPCCPVADDNDGESPLAQFLDDVALLTETESDTDDSASSNSGEKRVIAHLMTIHASKGMEFDSVFLVGNEEGVFPTQRAIAEGEGSVELNEERRLCYVAMTRAKTHLILTWRREVTTFFGQGFKVIDCDRSRFLDRLVSSGNNSKKKKGGSIAREKQVNKHDNSSHDLSLAERRRKLIEKQQQQGGTENSSRSGGTRQTKRRGSGSNLGKDSPQGDSWGDWSPKAPSSTANERRPMDPSKVSPAKRQRLSKFDNIPTTTNARRSSATGRPASAPNNRTHLSTKDRNPNNRTHLSTKDRNPSNSSRILRKKIQGDIAARSAPLDVDSTLFFPVGSSVIHKVHGAGTVLPPPTNEGDTMLVRVEFESGIQLDLPVGAGLKHKL